MQTMTKDLKIFLSSTYEDLKDAREDVLKFLKILNSDILTMEFFGSDGSHPIEYCLTKVRESNIFIGIYAERYGTIDNKTKMSITHLEYKEALKKYMSGEIHEILIYIIDKDANWPLKHIDREKNSVNKLNSLKKELSNNHTVTFFKDIEELPFMILKDVIGKIEINNEKVFSTKKSAEPLKLGVLSKPIGMEYYTEETENFFSGRELEIDDLQNQVLKHKMSLLIGISGIGKTSLINAGLLSKFKRLGWLTAVIRPLDNPISNLPSFLWDQLLNGVMPNDLDLLDVVNAINSANENKKTLIVIDQFEDILSSTNSFQIDKIVAYLVSLYNQRNKNNIHFLISYRGDLEPQLGKIWQKISGSPDGLPRFYLGPIDILNAIQSLRVSINALGIKFKDDDFLLKMIINDIEKESKTSGYTGVYPPFMQMVLTRIFNISKSNENYITKELYEQAGCSNKIIADFLLDQLKYFGEDIENCKLVLIALVSNYGTKTQKNLKELIIETALNESVLNKILDLLVDLRLVRKISKIYEIAHDLLAKIVLTEIVTDEQRNIKRFKSLLESKAHAYETTKADLTLAEHLNIYKYRERMSYNDLEVALLIKSFDVGNGPIFYWISQYPEYFDLIKHTYINFETDMPLKYSDFIHWDNSDELKPQPTLHTIKNGLNKRTSSNRIQLDYEIFLFIEKITLSDIREMINSNNETERFIGYYGLGFKGLKSDLKLLKQLENQIALKYKLVYVKSSFRIASRYKITPLINKILNSKEFVVYATESVTNYSTYLPLSFWIEKYKETKLKIDNVLNKIVTKDDIDYLKEVLAEIDIIDLDESIEFIVNLICKYPKHDDFWFWLEFIANLQGTINIKHSQKLADTIASLARSEHQDFIFNTINTDLFWNSDPSKENFSLGSLEIINNQNVYFIRWILAKAYSKIVKRETPEHYKILVKMFGHCYWNIRNAALEGIKKVGQPEDLDDLILKAQTINNILEIVAAIRFIDEKIYLSPELRYKLDTEMFPF